MYWKETRNVNITVSNLQLCVSDKQGASIPILGPNTAVVIEYVSTWAVKSG